MMKAYHNMAILTCAIDLSPDRYVFQEDKALDRCSASELLMNSGTKE